MHQQWGDRKFRWPDFFHFSQFFGKTAYFVVPLFRRRITRFWWFKNLLIVSDLHYYHRQKHLSLERFCPPEMAIQNGIFFHDLYNFSLSKIKIKKSFFSISCTEFLRTYSASKKTFFLFCLSLVYFSTVVNIISNSQLYNVSFIGFYIDFCPIRD